MRPIQWRHVRRFQIQYSSDINVTTLKPYLYFYWSDPLALLLIKLGGAFVGVTWAFDQVGPGQKSNLPVLRNAWIHDFHSNLWMNKNSVMYQVQTSTYILNIWSHLEITILPSKLKVQTAKRSEYSYPSFYIWV